MGGGTFLRSVARAAAAAAPTAAMTANAAYCSACTAAPSASPRTRAANCSCKAAPGPVQTHPALTAVSYGPQQFWDLDDWEFAGDEERDHYVFGSLPTVKEVEEASSDLQNALRLGFLTPAAPTSETFPKPESSSSKSPRAPGGPTIVDVTEVSEVSAVTTVGDTEEEVSSDLPTAPEVEREAWIEPPPYEMDTSLNATAALSPPMLEAFHQFQHNPQVQGIVVSLACDPAVYDAVLANEKVKEFRRNFSPLASEDSVSGATDLKGKESQKSTNIFSRLYWKSKQAFADFIARFHELVSSLFETGESNGPGGSASEKSNGPGGSSSEKSNVFDRLIQACMMLAIMVVAIVVFKRFVSFKKV